MKLSEMSLSQKLLSNNLLNLKAHPWFGRQMKKLKTEDFIIIQDFIIQNGNLDKAQFELKVNRMFLDKTKPKNWKSIMEILTVVNGGR